MCMLDIPNNQILSLTENLNRLSSQHNHCPHPTHALTPLWPNYQSFATEDVIKLIHNTPTVKNDSSDSQASGKQYTICPHCRPRQHPVTLKSAPKRVAREKRHTSSPKNNAQTDLAVRYSKLEIMNFLDPFCYCANWHITSIKAFSMYLHFYPKLHMAKSKW